MLTAALVLGGSAGAHESYVGVLVQLSGTAGCVSHDGTPGCATGRAVDEARGGIVSSDGKNFYVASETSGAIAIFSRNAGTGAITQLRGRAGCVSEDGAGGVCNRGIGLRGATGLAISADGKNLYEAGSGGVAAFMRMPTSGKLIQLAGHAGCVATGGTGGCTAGNALHTPLSVATSPDGRNVYVAAEDSNSVAIFKRNFATGALTQLPGRSGCVSEGGTATCSRGRALKSPQFVGVSPDGRNVYVAAPRDVGSVAVFARDRATGVLTQLAGTTGCLGNGGREGCGRVTGFGSPWLVAVSRDGRSAYIPAGAAVAAFSRSDSTGALTQLAGTAGCFSDSGSGGSCTAAREVGDAVGAAVSSDGANVYVAAIETDGVSGVSVFERDSAGALTQPAGTSGCLVDGLAGSCAGARAMQTPFTVSVSPDNRNVYVSTPGSRSVGVFARTTFTPPATTATTTAAATTTTTTTTSTSTSTTPAKADLMISSLTTFALTVTNAGNGPAGPFSVNVSGIGSFDFTGLAAGASSQASWKACIAGTTTATADPKNAVDESNETNNTAAFKHGC